MKKRCLVNTLACTLVALLLCLGFTACRNSEDLSYMSIGGGVLAIDFEKALNRDYSHKNKEKIFKQIVRELQNNKEPFHALVLSGSVPSGGMELFEPVAENITELDIYGEFSFSLLSAKGFRIMNNDTKRACRHCECGRLVARVHTTGVTTLLAAKVWL